MKMYYQQSGLLTAISTDFLFFPVKAIFTLLSPIDYFVFQNEENAAP